MADLRNSASDGVPAVILAGGQATRMGGRDKCLLPLAGRPLLSLIIARLAPQAAPLAINANGDPSRFGNFGLPVIADPIAGFAGPLAGILAAMEWAATARPTAPAVVTVAGDTPFFPDDLVARLGAAVPAFDRPALAATAAGLHPVFGLWPVALSAGLAAFLARDPQRKVRAFAEQAGAAAVLFAPGGPARAAADPFFNINTPADLSQAEAMVNEVSKP